MQRKYLSLIIISLLVLSAAINFLGALTPELGFDALWYHLTIPKIYLMWGRIDYIPGGLLYYSAMPKLGELLFMGIMKVMGDTGEIGAHLLSWGAGIATIIITYKIAKKVGLSTFLSLLSSLIFYVTPLVSWLSGSAYIDLIRTLFESLAFYFLISGNLILSGIAVGLAVSTKTLALGSLAILIIISSIQKHRIKNILKLTLPALILSVPWFIWSYQKTGYPFFPIGAGILDPSHNLVLRNPLTDFWYLFLNSPDPINPIYLIILPFAFVILEGSANWRRPIGSFKKILSLRSRMTLTIFYVIFSYLVWYLTPRTDWSRFILPYLPVWAVFVAMVISKIKRPQKLLIGTVIFIAVINLGYRALALKRTVPYLFGYETKNEYLCKNLDFKTEVFVDCDGYFARNIKKSDTVLISGFHNLYYVNFNFIHETWYKNEKVDYQLIYDNSSTSSGKLVYENWLTKARLYKFSP